MPVQEKQVRVDDTMEHSFIFYQKTKQIMKNVREKRSIKKHLFSACATFLTMLLAFVANAQDGMLVSMRQIPRYEAIFRQAQT